MIVQYKQKLPMLIISTLAMFIVAITLPTLGLNIEAGGTSSLIAIISSIVTTLSFGSLIFVTTWYLAKAKGRTGWWVLAPLFLNLLGFLIVLFLSDQSHLRPWENEPSKN